MARSLLLSLIGALLVFAGPAAADEGGVDGTPPVITNGLLSPGILSFEGGNVQISVDIIDESGLQMTSAQVYGSDGSSQAVSLSQGGGDTYYGTFEAPANFSDSTVSYQVDVQAYDTVGNYNSGTIGEIQVGPAPQFDEAPWVTLPTLNPSVLPPEGGTVTISAQAGDNRGLSAVFATVALPGGGSAEVGLNGISSNSFEGTYEVPANPGPLAAEYVVEVVAQDDIGQEGRALAGTITVEAPPPVSPGRLELSPDSRAFASVPVGKDARRQVFIRNLPRKGGAPVDAIARIAGSPEFTLPGAGPEGLPISLDPGKKLTLPIVFAPSTPGVQAGTLEIVRPDGGQPVLTVDLSGRGIGKGAR